MIGIYAAILKIEDTHVTCCMETGVLLFIYKYLNHENDKNLPLYFVIERTSDEKETVVIDVADFNFTILRIEQIEQRLKNCQLPVYSLNEYYCVAGFCAVLRQVRTPFPLNTKNISTSIDYNFITDRQIVRERSLAIRLQRSVFVSLR